MNKQNISLIIPSRNRLKYVQDLLNDLGRQTLPSDEIIVVDQSKQPYAISSNFNLVHIIDQERGPCHARNIGLEQSSGEILVFLDDDIRIEPDFLHHLCTPIINKQYSAVVGAMCDAGGNYPYKENSLTKRKTNNWLLTLTANPGFPGQSPTLSFTTCCSAIHRDVFEQVGGFDSFFDPNGAGEDREFGLRIFKAGFPILYNGKAYVRHLGVPSGGRRGSGMGFKYQNILQANSVYIVAKHFGWPVFNEYCSSWLRSILSKGKTLNPRLRIRTIFWWLEATKYISHIKELKHGSDW